MLSRLSILLLILDLSLLSGCRTIQSNITRSFYSQKQTTTIDSSKTGKFLKSQEFTGTIKVENVEVFYQQNLENQADCIARQIQKSLAYIRKSTGFQISFSEIKVYLIRVDEFPYGLNPMLVEAEKFVWLLFVEGDESCESIVSQNYSYPCAFIHEMIEVSLMYPKKGTAILNDLGCEYGWFKIGCLNYTRWFRDGFATYAGYLAYESISSDINFDRSQIPVSMMQNGLHDHPFMALNTVGKDLFTWPQCSNRKLSSDIDYYNAALGLFLVIEKQFGENAIKEIIHGTKTLKYGDGSDLIKLTNEVLHTDIKELAENFNFPRMGLKMNTLMPGEAAYKDLNVNEGLFVVAVDPNSSASNAGIEKDDVIIKINDKDVKTNLDFEIAIFDLMPLQKIKLTVWRRGYCRTITLML